VDFYEFCYRPVIGPLHIRREIAGGKLIIFTVVLDAFAANALAGTGFIGTVASGFIFLYLAFAHILLLCLI
jgi:hypothetical protein